MSGQESTYRPEGYGPHPTMAGNMFDPKVEADGMKGGLGVGGTSERRIKDEGAEHVAQHGLGQSGIGETGIHATTQHHPHTGAGVTGGLPGQSGYGTSGTSGGLTGGQSGLGGSQSYESTNYGSSGSHARNLEDAGTSIGRGEPTAAQTHSSGIDHIKSHSGAGHSGSGISGAGLGSSAAGVAGVEAGRHGTSTGDYDNSRSGLSSGTGLGSSTGDYSDSRSGTSTGGYGGSSVDPSTRHTGGNTTTDASRAAREVTGAGDDDLGTGRGSTRSSDPRTSGAPSSTSASDSVGAAGRGASSAEHPASKDHISGTTGKEQSSVAAAADSSDGRGGPPPNIPTAGGERIGTKHWGESKVIPDNPPRRPSEGEAGVSSHAGQSDATTKHNTAHNTGDLNTGASGETQKEGLMAKIKHSVGLGHNKE